MDGAAYKGLFDAVRDPCLLTSPSAVIQEANPAATSLLGMSHDMLRGKPLAVLVAPESRRDFRHAVADAVRGIERTTFLIGLQTRADGVISVAAEVLVQPTVGEPQTLLWLLRPLVEGGTHRRVEEILEPFVAAQTEALTKSLTLARSSEAMLRTVVDNLPAGILLIDAVTRDPIIVNAALLEMLGTDTFDRTRLLAPNGADIDEWTWPLDVVLRTRLAVVDERVALRRPDGGVAVMDVTATPLRARGKLTHVLGTFVDLSRIEARERSEIDFVADASHNLRTPLTVISTAVEILQGGAKEDPVERDRFLAHIEREVARMTLLTRSLLTLASLDLRGARPPLQPTPAAEVLRAVATRVEPNDGVEILVEVDDGVVARTDRALLEQALGNLAENAAKHTAQGAITFAAEEVDGGVAFRVSDTGSGIPNASDDLFQRFVRRETGADGFGLGLAIVRKIADALSAQIELRSEVGVGTSVSLVVPGDDASRGRSA